MRQSIVLQIHDFIAPDYPDDLTFSRNIQTGNELQIFLQGDIYCKGGVVLKVENRFETRTVGGLFQVRGFRFGYIAYVPGETWILKYHNLHADEAEYIHRIRDPFTLHIESETIARNQFPVMSEVLDELEILARRYGL